jgi:hypothetical protein
MNLPEYFGSTFKKKDNQWFNGNQQSTYELCICVQRKLKKDDTWMKNLYNTIRQDRQSTYGSYAGLNNWSHTFTDVQLGEFIKLVNC